MSCIGLPQSGEFTKLIMIITWKIMLCFIHKASTQIHFWSIQPAEKHVRINSVLDHTYSSY